MEVLRVGNCRAQAPVRISNWRGLGEPIQNLCKQDEHGVAANMEVPVRACRFAERFNDAANG